MKEKLLKNLDLKVLAVLFSVILWVIVVNIDDPVKSVQFTGVEVSIVNADELKNQGKVFEILDDTNNISVTVSGRRSVVEEITKDNIVAVADLKNLSDMGTVPIKVTANKSSGEIDDIKPDIANIQLNIEDLKKIQKPITVAVVGKPAEGYTVGELTTNLNQVHLEGPESIINSVSVVKAELDVEGAISNVNASVAIKLYDEAGNPVNASRVSMNIATVSVSQEILMTKVVPIDFNMTGEPENGYVATGEIVADFYEVKVAGKKNLVENVTGITIPAELLDIKDAKSNVTAVIDLDEYLPNGVDTIDVPNDGKVEVTVVIEKEATVPVQYTAENIEISGVPEGYTAEVLMDGTYLKPGVNTYNVIGLSENLKGLESQKLIITLDLNKYMEDNNLKTMPTGNLWVEGKVNIPEGTRIEQVCRFQVKIAKIVQ